MYQDLCWKEIYVNLTLLAVFLKQYSLLNYHLINSFWALWGKNFKTTTTMEHIFITFNVLTHWGRVTHIYVGKLTIIASDNGLSPGRRQTIIWTNAGILLIGLLGTSFSEISNEIQTFSFKKMHLKMSSAKWRPFCVGLNVLKAFRWVQVCKIVAQVVLKRHESSPWHDDVIKWKHFPRYWPFVRGIHRSLGWILQRPVTRIFDVLFDLLLNKRLSKQSINS